MADVSQIEVNGTTYDIIDAVSTNDYNELNKYFRWKSSTLIDEYIDMKNDPSNTARIVLTGSTSLCIKDDNNIYALNMWGDTGNIRYDKWNFNTETTTTLGYIPLNSNSTTNSYEYTNNTSLVTINTSGYSVGWVHLYRWGCIAKISISFNHPDITITIPANGKLSSAAQIATLASAWRPAQMTYLHSYGDNFGQAWGYLNTNGIIALTAAEARGAQWTSTGAFQLSGVYVLPMTSNY